MTLGVLRTAPQWYHSITDKVFFSAVSMEELGRKPYK